ncbi:MAG: hypothetical protein V3U20_07960 [Thermoplasmata archaeon]
MKKAQLLRRIFHMTDVVYLFYYLLPDFLMIVIPLLALTGLDYIFSWL